MALDLFETLTMATDLIKSAVHDNEELFKKNFPTNEEDLKSVIYGLVGVATHLTHMLNEGQPKASADGYLGMALSRSVRDVLGYLLEDEVEKVNEG